MELSEPDWDLIPGSFCDGCPHWSGGKRGHCMYESKGPALVGYADNVALWCQVLSQLPLSG